MPELEPVGVERDGGVRHLQPKRQSFSRRERADDPATATDPLRSAYGGWEAVTNAGLALSEATTLLDVSVVFGGENDERGLLGLAFHPRFAENHYVYLNFFDKSKVGYGAAIATVLTVLIVLVVVVILAVQARSERKEAEGHA